MSKLKKLIILHFFVIPLFFLTKTIIIKKEKQTIEIMLDYNLWSSYDEFDLKKFSFINPTFIISDYYKNKIIPFDEMLKTSDKITKAGFHVSYRFFVDKGFYAKFMQIKDKFIIVDGNVLYKKILTEILDVKKKNKIKIGVFEFSKQHLPCYDIIVHKISPKELNKMKLGNILLRWKRAVFERGIRILYIYPITNLPFSNNIDYLRNLKVYMEKLGYKTGRVKINNKVKSSFILVFAKRILALLMAILIPSVMGILLIRKAIKENIKNNFFDIYKVFILISLISIFTGMWVFIILGHYKFYGVKLALVVPIIVMLVFLSRGREVKGFFNSVVKMKDTFLISIISVFIVNFAFLLLIRSGNVNFSFPFEHKLRNILETMLIIRPRFKEFIIGHPLLILGLAFCSFYKKRILGCFLLTFGFIGQTSIINSFCHTHTPVIITLIRSIYGLTLGSFVGLTFVGFFKMFLKHSE